MLSYRLVQTWMIRWRDRSHTWKIFKNTVRGSRPPCKTDTTASKKHTQKKKLQKRGEKEQ